MLMFQMKWCTSFFTLIHNLPNDFLMLYIKIKGVWKEVCQLWFNVSNQDETRETKVEECNQIYYDDDYYHE